MQTAATAWGSRHSKLKQKFKIENGIDLINWHAAPLKIAARAENRKTFDREIVRSCNSRHHFFNNRMAPYLDALPTDIILAKSTNTFKNGLDRHFAQTNSFCLRRRQLKQLHRKMALAIWLESASSYYGLSLSGSSLTELLLK